MIITKSVSCFACLIMGKEHELLDFCLSLEQENLNTLVEASVFRFSLLKEDRNRRFSSWSFRTQPIQSAVLGSAIRSW